MRLDSIFARECKGKGYRVLIRGFFALKQALISILVFAFVSVLLVPIVARSGAASAWNWTTETVDDSSGFSSVKVDARGNVHLAYIGDGDRIKYAFRDAATSKWFSMIVDKAASYTSLVLDSSGDPHICYTQRTMRYAAWNGRTWDIQTLAPGSGAIAYYCSVAVANDGTPHVTWYQERDTQDANYLHMRYAVLKNGAWLARTIDFDPQTGKWETMALDKQGYPHICYDSFVFGQLKYASWDGKAWSIQVVDSRGGNSDQPGRGMGNSLVLDSNGRAMISYFEDSALKYARETDHGWSIETITSTNRSLSWSGYRTSQALDSAGLPHIAYEDAGTLRHAYWDGKVWHFELIARRGPEPYRYESLAIGGNDTIYISYRDPDDGSQKVAIGRPRLSGTETR